MIAMQAHLRCEDLLPGKATPGRMDRRTAEGLKVYQRLQMLADNANIDPDTRAVLLGDSREHDFRALLRVLRERVVDATGLLEDGSALGVQGEVQGRVLDSRRVPAAGRAAGQGASPAAPPRGAGPRRSGQRRRRPRRNRAAAAAEASAKIVPGAGSDRARPPRRPARRWAGRHRTPSSRARWSPPAAAGAKNGAQADGAQGPGAAARRPSRSSCRRCRRTTARRWSCARRSIAARWSWRGRSSTRTDTRSGSRPVADRPTLTLYAQRGRPRGGPLPLADHHRRLEDVREDRRHHGAQVQGVRHGRRPVARGPGHADLAPGAGHAHPQAAHQAAATPSSRRRRSSAPATARPTGWWRSCTTRSWSGTRRASRS